MTSFDRWLQLLRCPDCGTGFAFTPFADEQRGAPGYGILRCQCFRYPVVDGVPILTKGHVGLLSFSSGKVESKGPAVEEVAELVAKKQGFEALVRCLAFTPRLEIFNRLPGWRLWHTGIVPALLRQWIEGRARRMLKADRQTLSAEDWFAFFFGSLTATDRSLLPYYRNRFVLPRTLAALSLLRLLPAAERPVLDLACGFGPFGHYLTNRRTPTAVIGVDFNFYLVWGQKHWIAPQGTFICADANRRLPFVDDAFSAVLCSDAFGYFRNKAETLAELDRCASGKPVILSRVSNKTAWPNEVWGDEYGAEEYMQLLRSRQPRPFGDYALVRNYLARRNPLASQAMEATDLRWDKWLTFVLNGRSLGDVGIDPMDEWPHQVGKLTPNPMFERRSLPNGKQKFAFRFPTTWFAYQNGDMYGYHGDGLECSSETLDRARLNRADPDLKRLIEHFIVIGLPERYLKAQRDSQTRGGHPQLTQRGEGSSS